MPLLCGAGSMQPPAACTRQATPACEGGCVRDTLWTDTLEVDQIGTYYYTGPGTSSWTADWCKFLWFGGRDEVVEDGRREVEADLATTVWTQTQRL